MKKIVLEKSVVDEILRLYNEEMLGSPSISEKLNVKKHIVLRVLKENGVSIGPSGRKFKGGKKVADKKWRDSNKEFMSNKSKTWYENNKEHRKEYLKKYREKNVDKIR